MVAACLAAGGRGGDARRFAIATATALGAMLALKLVLGTYPEIGGRLGLGSPSGHAASAVLAYGGVAWVLSGRRAVGIAAGTVAGIGIGATRTALGMHTPQEAALGAAIGVLGLAYGCAGGAGKASTGTRITAAVALVALVLGLHGLRAPIEPRLVAIEAALRFETVR